MDKIKNILDVMPLNISKAIEKHKDIFIEEIRIKLSSPIFLYSKNKEYFLYNDNEIIYATKEDISYILKKATKNSLYTYTEDIKNGFITIEGGHRIGIGGRAVYEKGRLINIKDISFLNIRCANEIEVVGEEILNKIFYNDYIYNTLIIAPPKCGKTTFLRDLTRLISNNRNVKLALIDERDEIASSFMGLSSNNVGDRTFVLSGYLKKDGFSHAVRSLSPDAIICDEIGNDEDFEAIYNAIIRGVKIIATIHGKNIEDIIGNNKYHAFERVVVLDKFFNKKIYKLDKGEYIEL